MLEKMKNENGYFELDGKEYILTQQAYLDGTNDHPYYQTMAICTADKADEDGWQPAYEVRWELREDYNAEDMGEDMACDWDETESVREIGEYNITEERFA